MSRTPKICKSQQVTKVPAIVSLARKSAKQSKPWNILEPFDKSFGTTQNLGGFGAVGAVNPVSPVSPVSPVAL